MMDHDQPTVPLWDRATELMHTIMEEEQISRDATAAAIEWAKRVGQEQACQTIELMDRLAEHSAADPRCYRKEADRLEAIEARLDRIEERLRFLIPDKSDDV